MSLTDERLQFTPPTPQLNTYDTLLLKARSEQDSQNGQNEYENHPEKKP